MSIQAIPAISAIAPPSAVMGITGTNGPVAGASATAGADFAGQLGAGLENLQALQTKSDNLAIQAATGQLTDVHDYIIASTEANLATQLTVAVRNKALDAFNEIMRMQA
jgi:flagellar hook-basal body complex protein FliE